MSPRTLYWAPLLLALAGCPTDTGPGPDPEDAGAGLCPAGVLTCDWGEGCHDGICGPCAIPDECHTLEGCRDDGSCGPCEGDGHCREGESCVFGECMPDELPRWQLIVDEADWEDLLEHEEEDTYVPCTLVVGDAERDDGAELRLRGGSTRSLPKKSLRIRFPEDAEHPGYSRKINLRAEYNDPSFLRSFLGFEMFRRHSRLPTPQARYLRLDLNGEYYGLMLETERIGGRFLELRGRDRDAATYEGADVDDEGALTPNDDPDEYRVIYAKTTGDETDYGDLEALIEGALWGDYLDSSGTGDTVSQRVSEEVHLGQYLVYLALMAVIQSQDHVTNNFYFSHQTVGVDGARWEFYAADTDLTFGCLWDEENGDPLCDSFHFDGWWLNGWIPDDVEPGVDPVWGNLLIHLVVNDPQLAPIYVQQICAIVGGLTWNERLPALIDALSETIAEAALDDVHDMSQTAGEVQAAQDEVFSFVELRREYLRDALGCP